MLRRLWERVFPPKPCNCHACVPLPPRPKGDYESHNPNIHHGLHMWVGRDGKLHYREKSSYRPLY